MHGLSPSSSGNFIINQRFLGAHYKHLFRRYIDASSRIEHDERWRFFVVFEKFEHKDGETRYASVGYASIYLYYHYPDKVNLYSDYVL